MFLALLQPVFSLQVLLRLEAEPWPGAAVVTEATGKQSRVVAASEEARAAGVEPGHSAAQARARRADVRLYTRQPALERAAMDLLFALAYAHTPFIERTAPGLLTLELRGLRHGSVEHLAHTLLGELHAHGFTPRLGLAPTADLALFTARATSADAPLRQTSEAPGRSFHSLPLASAHPAPDLLATLQSWGLQTLGDLLALPLAEVARRLGEPGRILWDQAAGQRTRVLERASPPERFSAEHALDHPVRTLEPLLFLLQRLLEQLTAQLRAAGRCASALQIQLSLDHAPPYARTFQLPAPTTRTELLFRVLHLHLEQVRTEAAITGLALAATPVDPPHRQQGLFHTQLKDPWQLLETQTQLVGLVGHERVGRPQMVDTHRPDAFSLNALPAELPPLEPAALARLRRPRETPPLRRLRPPQPCHVVFTHGRLRRLEHPRWQGPVRAVRGPFHQSGEWWQRDTFWTRREWDVTLADGTALRLVHTPTEGWLVEGLYD